MHDLEREKKLASNFKGIQVDTPRLLARFRWHLSRKTTATVCYNSMLFEMLALSSSINFLQSMLIYAQMLCRIFINNAKRQFLAHINFNAQRISL